MENENIFIANIGIKSVTLGGGGCVEYKYLPNSQLEIQDIHKRDGVVEKVRTLYVRYDTEDGLYQFIQELIDKGIPVLSGAKNDAIQDINWLLENNKIKGVVKVYESQNF